MTTYGKNKDSKSMFGSYLTTDSGYINCLQSNEADKQYDVLRFESPVQTFIS